MTDEFDDPPDDWLDPETSFKEPTLDDCRFDAADWVRLMNMCGGVLDGKPCELSRGHEGPCWRRIWSDE